MHASSVPFPMSETALITMAAIFTALCALVKRETRKFLFYGRFSDSGFRKFRNNSSNSTDNARTSIRGALLVHSTQGFYRLY